MPGGSVGWVGWFGVEVLLGLVFLLGRNRVHSFPFSVLSLLAVFAVQLCILDSQILSSSFREGIGPQKQYFQRLFRSSFPHFFESNLPRFSLTVHELFFALQFFYLAILGIFLILQTNRRQSSLLWFYIGDFFVFMGWVIIYQTIHDLYMPS